MDMLDGVVRGDACDRLAIYLNDHRAGAEAAQALVRRTARAEAGNQIGAFLADELLPELADDRALLEQVRGRLGVRPNPVKQWGARVGELLGRAKLNGALVGRSPLSRVLELEAMIAGVSAKRQMWCVLVELWDDEAGELERALARADRQIEHLRALHAWASAQAFDRVTAPIVQP